MKTTRTVIIPLFVMLALFLAFRTAEAAPRSPVAALGRGAFAARIAEDGSAVQLSASAASAAQPVPQPDPALRIVEPAVQSPVVQLAPDLDADISVAVVDAPDPVLVTHNLTYTITVTNNAVTQTVTSVVMTDTLPGTVALVSATPLNGGTCGPTAPVVCQLGSLLAGGTSKVVIVVTPGSTGSITNSATAKAAEADPNLLNNTGTAGTTVNPLADLSLSLTVSKAAPYMGSTIAYTVTLTNSGPSQATGVVVRDLLPDGYTFVSYVANPAVAYSSSTGDWSVGTLNSGASATLRLNATVKTTGTYSNFAQVFISPVADPDSTPGNGSNTEDDNATLATTPLPAADLSITKSGSTTATAGTSLVYTLAMNNAGPSTATSVLVTDTLPVGMTSTSATGTGWICSAVVRAISCTRDSLAVGAGPAISVNVYVDPSARGTLTNRSRISSTLGDPNTANNTSNLNTTVSGAADLSLTKIVSNATPYVGNTVAFTVTVTNNGPSQATGVTIQDLLPDGYTYTGYSTNQGTYDSGTGVWTVGSLSLDASKYLRLNATVKPSGTYSNNAQVSAHNETDSNSSNDSATRSTTPLSVADLSITKTDTPATVAAGSLLTYTLTVTNNGPSGSTSLILTDTLPTGVTYQAPAIGTWSCSQVTNKIICTLPSLAAAQNSQVKIRVLVSSGQAAGTISNTAVVRSAATDSNLANNTATESTTVTTSADLSITKVDKTDPVVAGTNLVYTLTVSNAGPSDAVGVTISDTLPAALTSITSVPGSPTCTVTSQLLSCNVGTLLPGGTSRVVVTTQVKPATLPGSLTNSAVVGSTSPDPVLGNNRATQTTAVNSLADPSIAKLDKPDNGVMAGSTLVYTLTVSNSGPSNAANLVVSDTLPASVSYQAIDQGPFSCLYDSGTQRVTCTLSTLAPSGTARAVVTTKVNSSTPAGTITNVATVTSSSADSNTSNNRASQSTTVTTQANLSIAKLDAPDPVIAGTNLEYTLTIANAGPSDALGVVVTDTLPTGLTYQSFTGSGWTCTTPAASKVRCTRTSLTGSTNSSVVLTTLVGSGVTAQLFNAAVVTSNTIDPNAANNSANATTTVNSQADVGVSISHKPEPVVAGTNIVYTITVANTGPSDAQNVVLTEKLPSGTSYFSMNAGGASCTQVVNTITCSFTSIVTGTNRQVVVTALVAPGTSGAINNVASLNGTGGVAPNNRTSDLNSANDSYTDIANLALQSDFSLIKTDKPDPVMAGSSLVYTLTVVNDGPSNAVDAVVTDTLPAGVTYQTSSGTGWTCTLLTGARVRCTRAGMTADTSSSVVLYLLVNSSTTGTLTNTALVGSSTVDPNAANNTAQQVTTVNTSADLSLAKIDYPDPVVAGSNLTYTVTVSNLGPSDAAGVVMTDTLPANVTYQSYTGANWTCTLNGVNLRCVRTTNLVAAASDSVVILTKVKSATTTALSNTAIVRATTTDPVSTNNSKTEATTVQTSADLRVNKIDTIDPVIPGNYMAYTIVITNTGPSDAVGVKITDTLPVGVSYATHVPTPEWVCQVVSGELHCSRAASMVASTTLQIDVAVLVDASVTSTLSNLVRVGSSTPDPVTTNNSDTELTAVTPQSDLNIAKIESVDPVVAGTNLTYTLTVSNTGPSHAANLVVTDTLPANVTYQSFGGSSGWTCTLLTGNQLRCTRASLNKNTASVISVLTKVQSGATGSLSNTAVVRSAWTDPSLSNNSVTIGTSVTQSADLSVDKTDSPDPVAEGRPLTYTMVVKNNGPSDAATVSLNDAIPSGVTFLSAVSTQGSCSGSGPVNCSLGSVVSGGVVTITVTTTANPVANTPKTVSNTATVTAATQDPTPANNSKTVSTQVLPAADLQIHLESASGEVQTGQTMTYTLWVTNTGLSTAINVVVTDTLPAEMAFKSSSLTPASTSPKVIWNSGNLLAGASISFSLVVDVTSPTQALVNQVSVASSVWDIFPASNQDQVSVQAFDTVPPTATWELPVTNGGSVAVGNETVLLEVLAEDNVGVSYVRFYRWDAINLTFVDIGYDYSAATCQFNPSLMCFQWSLDTTVLNPEWNEIRARAYDASGNPSPSPSQNSFIFIYRNVHQVYLPFVKK